MTTEDGRYVISYKGEVFNFQELRVESSRWAGLSGRGPTPRSYSRRSRNGASMRCPFQRAVCVRRLGSPIRVSSFWLAIARDQAALRAIAAGARLCLVRNQGALVPPACAPAVDPEGLFDYLTFQNSLRKDTVQGHKLVPAGSWCSIDRPERRLRRLLGFRLHRW